MPQSQKTEQQSGHWGSIDLEGRRQPRVRSTASGEDKMRNGANFQDMVLSPSNLNMAYLRVKRNKGAAGVDGMSIEEALPYLQKHRKEFVTALRQGTYKPAPVRRVEIPKPDGSMRKLGIPTVLDRIVQQAVAQVLSPKFEKVFSDNSFGFRPGRSPHQAIRRVEAFYDQGYHYVVDLDLKAYFDTVNHDLLMKFLEQYVPDPWVLHLVRQFLTSGVMNGKLFEPATEGTPQGGNLSPLLANIYLNELDKLLTARGHKFVRYADDCNIYVKSKRAGMRVLASVTKFLEGTLKVTVNQQKTSVGSPTRLTFLGFSLGASRGKASVRVSQKAKRRVKDSLRTVTKRNRGRSLDVLLTEIRKKMVGWLHYYGIGSMKTFIHQLDEWLHSRIRQYIWKAWKKTGKRIRSLQRLGMSFDEAYIFANTRKGAWRIAHSQTLTRTITNERLERRGLLNLSATYQDIHARLSY
ncbi:group II intron reverse transcriptase/maturase [Schleiferilactobacillus shenzhenensis]|uniref:group II intron reverse transcriptase/maturase n=1 Tax=Schleiferilactobacillus shenzhenensis TaxID=1231337 RepID=UPI0004082EE9|nr:group II intron reverse transcriptase/maturase [Schleiferilactobacillus shenzhenensis]